MPDLITIPTQASVELPVSITGDAVLNAKQAAKFLSLSVVHFRRMSKADPGLRPIRLSERRFGWRIKALRAWLDSREAA